MEARQVWRNLDAFRAYNRSRNLSPKTLQTYHGALRGFFKWFVARHGWEAEITARRIREFAADRLDSGKKRLTVCSELTALQAFFSFLVLDEVIPESENPMRLVRKPKGALPEIKPLQMEEVRRLLGSFDKQEPIECRNYLICLLILDTGLRIGEVARLQLKDMDMAQSSIAVNGKGRRPRTVYMGCKTSEVMQDYMEHQRPIIANSNGTLFPPATRSQKATMRPNYLSAVIREKMDEVGIPRANSSAHRLRHTFAANFIKADGNVFALQKLLGHSQLDMTRRYVMLFDNDLAEAHRRASPVDRMII